MTQDELADLAHLRRARDLMDREYARPLDIAAVARAALMSPAHFSRRFRRRFGMAPASYRRVASVMEPPLPQEIVALLPLIDRLSLPADR